MDEGLEKGCISRQMDRGSDRGIERKEWRARKMNGRPDRGTGSGRGEKRDVEVDR